MSSYWVRPATRQDGKAVRDLARRVVREFRVSSRWAASAVRDGEQELMWVVEAGRGEIVGSCGLREAEAGEWELHSLYLAPEFRGIGLGRNLVENAVRVARQHGAATLVFVAPAEFQDAQALVRRLGFTAVADGAAGACRMELALAGVS